MPWDGQVPYHMPLSHADTLSHTLRPFTTTPEKIWYLVWDGYGSILPTSQPRVQRPHRNYLPYYGGIDDTRDLGIDEHREPPEYWFPDDKSWCVATDVDLCWTYVGGSKACIDAILNSSELESVPAELSHGLTVDSDIFNRLSPDEKKQWGY
ncbi:hypothetical protein [Alicyclobacillus tolerans]|uniref:Uncharacterized protein n=1 Tax=Alicyclobacillus tolerans TaxID=90970 RepID=A0A1M6TLF0_9BACL|nr:hypothetical protein [Alicyclobacillus montanus]SHK57764.1 hypothetical protein SAMN05443507_1178 [Alicyclobacillus montanus]